MRQQPSNHRQGYGDIWDHPYYEDRLGHHYSTVILREHAVNYRFLPDKYSLSIGNTTNYIGNAVDSIPAVPQFNHHEKRFEIQQ
ncbi:hypothetical protein TNIN_225811 [Trichonephila inaurata madagascariensis]|uniref:Uncharacterized protein n=1 Tax=Trichonephila inaurata madagascariensis TaxID=2747483 RepID=A0A8X6YGT5_9ARAC|nr:hypothetical protein TNIN_225811 [Trichonephila inaurata madagascariensis]